MSEAIETWPGRPCPFGAAYACSDAATSQHPGPVDLPVTHGAREGQAGGWPWKTH